MKYEVTVKVDDVVWLETSFTSDEGRSEWILETKQIMPDAVFEIDGKAA